MRLGRRDLRVGVVALALLLAACQASTTPSVPPTPTDAGATANVETIGPGSSPSASPSPAAPPPTVVPSSAPTSAPIVVFAPGQAIEVTVDGLNLRTKPSTTAKKISTLKRDAVVVVSPIDAGYFGWGPVKANGYAWYPVTVPNAGSTAQGLPALPQSPFSNTGPDTSGWIATDNGTVAYVAAVAPRCPTTATLEMVSGMLPAERLACFAGNELTLTGTFGCGGCSGAVFGTFKPDWLATPVELDLLSVKPADRLGPVGLRFPPAGPASPALGSIIKVMAHFDDARASTCAIDESDGLVDVMVKSQTAVLYCRERLVVDSYKVLGTDPTFP